MAQQPYYEVYRFDDKIKELREKAIVEVLTLSPGEKQWRLGSYGLDQSCEELSEKVIRGLNRPLIRWATKRGAVIEDLERPHFRPEAFRLHKGSVLWPGPHATALLVPLSNGNAHIELMPRGTNDVIPYVWDPRTVLHVNEMGFQFRGTGSVRFIYILFQTAPASKYQVR
ncbi:hypothetical protein F53441_8451 [Fusarium austroafricanum]|uniref:Uncharacterized protein n=1 Tax=Fusarium austroafricanum TaxID=2364996 RepID=A0A8H4KBE4_9HYPO|nr:hypothetical protein F53441_8451 [Fusarium austroafricanum]